MNNCGGLLPSNKKALYKIEILARKIEKSSLKYFEFKIDTKNLLSNNCNSIIQTELQNK